MEGWRVEGGGRRVKVGGNGGEGRVEGGKVEGEGR